MILKSKGFRASLGIAIFILLLLALKWPLNISSVDPSREEKPEVFKPEASLPEASKTEESPVQAEPVSTPVVSKFPADGIPILMYHSISTIPGNSLGVPVPQFSEEMEWLHRQNYKTLTLEEFYQALVNKSPVPDKPILLTFDDGYSDNYSSAWPILHQYGFRATFFVITSSVGKGMMTWNQLDELLRQGNSISSHTVHHPDLATLSSKQQENELLLSKKELENHLGNRVEALCFPSSRHNETTLRLMSQLDYKLGFTTQAGKVHLGDNPLALKRMRISGGMSLTAFQKQFP